MGNQELVSVITPTYNSEAFISATIESVLHQTYENWEMIIVDDASADSTREIISVYAEQDSRIKPIFLKENGGAAVARNKALHASKGTFMAFLDGDDQWLPEKLERQIRFMKEKDYAFTFTNYEIMDEKGTPLGKYVEAPAQMTYQDLLKNTIIGCLTVIVNREKTGPFQMPNIRTRQDLALWLQLLRKGFTAYGLQESLSRYRVVPNSISSNKIKAAKKNWFVYRHIEKLSLIKSAWYFSHYALNAIKKRI